MSDVVPGHRGEFVKRVYTAESVVQVTHIKNMLEAAGVQTEMRNQRLAGGVGEIPFLETWPELWAAELDAARARELVEEALHGDTADETPWTCAGCGERSEGQFAVCWQCGRERPHR